MRITQEPREEAIDRNTRTERKTKGIITHEPRRGQSGMKTTQVPREEPKDNTRSEKTKGNNHNIRTERSTNGKKNITRTKKRTEWEEKQRAIARRTNGKKYHKSQEENGMGREAKGNSEEDEARGTRGAPPALLKSPSQKDGGRRGFSIT